MLKQTVMLLQNLKSYSVVCALQKSTSLVLLGCQHSIASMLPMECECWQHAKGLMFPYLRVSKIDDCAERRPN